MPLTTVTHHSGWSRADLRGGAHPLVDGSLTLAPDNLLSNPMWARIGQRGVAEGWTLPAYPEIDGHMVYVSEPGGQQSTMTAQSVSPVGLDVSAWVGSEPIVFGRKPLRNRTHAANVPRPEAVEVRNRDRAKAGFPADEYHYGYTEVSGSGLETQLSGLSRVEAAEGETIRVPLPEISEDAAAVRLYLSEPGRGPGSMRLQRELKRSYYLGGGRQYHTLTEYHYGKRPPEDNETYIGSGRHLNRRREIRRQRSRFTLRAGDYRVTYTYRTKFGESLPAPWSRVRRIVSERRGQCLAVKPPPRRRGAIGFYIYVEHDGEVYRLEPTRRSGGGHYRWTTRGGSRPWLPVQGPEDDTSEEEISETRRRRLARLGGPRHVLVSAEPPEEDESGMEGPDAESEPDEPEARGAEKPPADDYWVTTAYTADAEPGVAGPNVKHTVDEGEVMAVELPSPVNLLRNPEFSERDSSGDPRHWSFTMPSSGSRSVKAGKLTIETDGPSEDGHETRSDRLEVNTSSTFMVRGVLEASITDGECSVQLRQYDESGDNLGSSLDIAVTDSSGRIEFEQTFSASDLDALTAEVALAARAITGDGSTVNASFSVFNLAIHPYDVAQRKLSPSRRDGLPTDYNPTADHPYHRSSHVGFGLPPAYEPMEDASGIQSFVDFEGGDFSEAESDGWTLVENGNDSNGVNDVTEGAAIEGDYGWRNSNGSGQEGGTRFLEQDFGSRDSHAARLMLYIETLPGGTDNFIDLLRLGDGENDEEMARLLLDSGGRLYVRIVPSSGPGYDRTIYPSLSEGGTVDVELVGNADGADSTLTVLANASGGARVIKWEEDVDWSGLSLGRVRFGVVSKSNSLARHNFALDSAIVSENGAPTSGISEPPEGEDAPDPDRPESGGEYRETDEEDNELTQLYAFVLPGDRREMPTSEPVAVIPGETYTAGIWARHHLIDEGQSDSGTEYPDSCNPLRLTAIRRDGHRRNMGTLWQAEGEEGWDEHTLTVEIPDGYYELEITGGEILPGEYVAQEPTISPGDTALYGSGGASEGGFTLTLDGCAPEPEDRPAGVLGISANGITEWVVREVDYEDTSEDEDAVVTARYRSGSDQEEMGSYHDDPSDVERGRLVHIDVEMESASDGTAPTITDVAVEWRHRLPTLVRADGTPLPGGTAVQAQDSVSRPDYDAGKLAGLPRITPETEEIERLYGLTVQFYSPEGADEFAARSVEDEWLVEDPEAGRAYLVELYEPVEPEEEGLTRGKDPYVHSDVDIDELFVAESSELESLT